MFSRQVSQTIFFEMELPLPSSVLEHMLRKSWVRRSQCNIVALYKGPKHLWSNYNLVCLANIWLDLEGINNFWQEWKQGRSCQLAISSGGTSGWAVSAHGYLRPGCGQWNSPWVWNSPWNSPWVEQWNSPWVWTKGCWSSAHSTELAGRSACREREKWRPALNFGLLQSHVGISGPRLWFVGKTSMVD